MKIPSKVGEIKKIAIIQSNFWNEVGSAEHISLPRLKDSIRKQFNFEDDRLVKTQIDLMQSEQRIRIESNVKVWIKRPAETN